MMMMDYLKSLNKALSTEHPEQLFSIAGSIIWIKYVGLGSVKGIHTSGWQVTAPAHKDRSSTPAKYQPAGKQGEQSCLQALPLLPQLPIGWYMEKYKSSKTCFTVQVSGPKLLKSLAINCFADITDVYNSAGLSQSFSLVFNCYEILQMR